MGWSLILFDFDLLDHPLCCHPLMSPIFQASLYFLCENGYIACSSCCIKLMRNKCTSCTLPVGIYRCRILEKLVEAVILTCPNAKHGCTKKSSYGKDLVHQENCGSTMCYCPAPNCNYTGMYEDLDNHFTVWHNDSYSSRFMNRKW
ncbi:E3 ubiquitin-protein ligase SINA-like 2 [Capsella rubella]|uniref:E3 ubiquitin-protein ligase SINA-like 2 n=1 Tax=Capsella rubella TaxID=81985 RepID=UPI000CD59F9E|nr:E3 ubiquitin-protein ligase SINA-like 2 [Capsella rubella]